MTWYTKSSITTSSSDHNFFYVYRVQGIILYKQVIRDNHIRNVIFTQEYGKITAWQKGGQSVDIGSVVEVLIDRQGNQNTIKKIQSSYAINLDSWSYHEVIEYLHMIKILYHSLPEGVEHRKIYNDLYETILGIESGVGKVGILLILQLKILRLLGYIAIAADTYRKIIYDSVHAYSMKSILHNLALIGDEAVMIKKHILEVEHRYLSTP